MRRLAAARICRSRSRSATAPIIRRSLAMRAAGAAEVHCVDTWRGTDDPRDETHALGHHRGQREVLRAFVRNVGPGFGRVIFPYVGDSAFWAEIWPWRADLIFLDADHR